MGLAGGGPPGVVDRGELPGGAGLLQRGRPGQRAGLADQRRPASSPWPIRATKGGALVSSPKAIHVLLAVIDPLTNPTAHGGNAANAFDVVIPSIPGYGYSGKPAETGWGPDRIARAWTELMKRLGYTSSWPKAATGARSSPT